MKKLFIISAIAMSGLIYNTANAQFRIRVGFRFAPQRVYRETPVVVEQAPVYDQPAPANNYSNDDYYYLPDVDAYYNVDEQCYYYFDGDNWISAAYLPGEYRDYDWRNARRFEIRGDRPYLHNDIYRSRYNGNNVNAYWERHDDHFGGGNRNWDQNAYSNRDGRFGNRQQNGYDRHDQPYQHQGDNNQRFNDRNPGGYDQHNNSGRDNNNSNRGRDNNNGQSAQPNRSQGGYDSRPSNQNSGLGQQNKGGNEHFAQSSPQGGYRTYRMNKF